MVTAIWGRPNITRLFLDHFQILKEYDTERFELDLVVVGSDVGADQDVLDEYECHYIQAPNRPLGAKWNSALKKAEKLDWEYLLILGSDDLISPATLELYLSYINLGHDFIGFRDLFIYSTLTKNLKYWMGYQGQRKGESCGAGRLLHRSLVKACHFYLWEFRRNAGLDGSMMRKLNKIEHNPAILSMKREDVMILDVKSRLNMGSFESLPGIEQDLEKLDRHFSFEIVSKIQSL